jgi:hypothetical protein
MAAMCFRGMLFATDYSISLITVFASPRQLALPDTSRCIQKYREALEVANNPGISVAALQPD